MSQYRRLHAPDSTWFFTVCLAQAGGTLLTDRIDALREAYRRTVVDHPVDCLAMVVLPDRIHALWALPGAEADYSLRWRLIKGRFTHFVGRADGLRPSLLRRREGGIWQRRFWEHRIRDAADFAAHWDLCLSSPVAAGLVAEAEDWPFSTLHRDRRAARQSAVARIAPGTAGPVIWRANLGNAVRSGRVGNIAHPTVQDVANGIAGGPGAP